MSNAAAQQGKAGATQERVSVGTAIERCAGLALRNRFFWLAFGCSLYLGAQLDFAQYKWDRFNTLELVAHLLVILEAGLLACALITALSFPRMAEAWRERWPGLRCSPALAGLGGMLALLVPFALQLGPQLLLHSYPGLAKEGVSIPLLLLQRGTLLLYAVWISYSLTLTLRYTLRAPAWLCAIGGLGCHWGLAWGVTWLSLHGEALRRLNDLFYVNQLWRYWDSFPKLTRPEVFFNMQADYGVFLGWGVLLVAATTLLWLPTAGRAK